MVCTIKNKTTLKRIPTTTVRNDVVWRRTSYIESLIKIVYFLALGKLRLGEDSGAACNQAWDNYSLLVWAEDNVKGKQTKLLISLLVEKIV